jgi:hypothetical protein
MSKGKKEYKCKTEKMNGILQSLKPSDRVIKERAFLGIEPGSTKPQANTTTRYE